MNKRVLNQSSLKLSIIANFLGNIWPSIIGLVAIPFYLKFLGTEAYGLIGVFASLQAILSVLDGGLSTTLNRELAKYTSSNQLDDNGKVRNTVRTLEIVYWILALIVGVIAFLLSPFIAKNWVNARNLLVYDIQISFSLLSVSLIFQLPNGFYSGGLSGLHKQVSLNVLRVLFSTLKSFGAILVLYFYSNTVIVFFEWILLITILQAIALRGSLWYYLPSPEIRAVFDKNELKRIWRFAAGITGISITTLVISQIDKVILSKILPLSQFGYYSLAATLGFLVFQIIGPLTQSFFPKFASYANKLEFKDELVKIYHNGCQLISVLILPATFILFFFSKELLYIWTQNAQTADYSWKIVSIFALGCGFNGMMHMPHELTLAYGWTKLAFYTNIILIIVLIPFTIFFTIKLGGIGGALSWLCANVIYFLFIPHVLYSRILKGEKFKWYLNDCIKPFVISFVFIGIFRLIDFRSPFNSKVLAITYICVIGAMAVIANILSMKSMYVPIFEFLKKIKKKGF
jgi:O-antigen/teichoic acid export membrane protein